MLDGGWNAWEQQGLETESGEVETQVRYEHDDDIGGGNDDNDDLVIW